MGGDWLCLSVGFDCSDFGVCLFELFHFISQHTCPEPQVESPARLEAELPLSRNRENGIKIPTSRNSSEFKQKVRICSAQIHLALGVTAAKGAVSPPLRLRGRPGTPPRAAQRRRIFGCWAASSLHVAWDFGTQRPRWPPTCCLGHSRWIVLVWMRDLHLSCSRYVQTRNAKWEGGNRFSLVCEKASVKPRTAASPGSVRVAYVLKCCNTSGILHLYNTVLRPSLKPCKSLP